MFVKIKQMLIGLLNVCTKEIFSKSFVSSWNRISDEKIFYPFTVSLNK